MLTELHVRDLGVIADLHLVFEPGMTAVTGETGAGKTLVVEAIELLVGGKADAVLVRTGAVEATIEGRFVVADEEIVLRRVVPAAGRSRAYRDGGMVPLATLGDVGAALVDLHGQHAHQSLLGARGQRAALDAFAAIDHAPLRAARARVQEVDAELAALGGDPRERARELELVQFQVLEIDEAALDDTHEDARLEQTEELLADAFAHRAAGHTAHEHLTDEAAAIDRLRHAIAALGTRSPFAAEAERLRAIVAEADDIATSVRRIIDTISDDPERLETVRARRQLLVELKRKYGATLAEVVVFRDDLARRATELESHADRIAGLVAARADAAAELDAAAARIASERRRAAPEAAKAIQRHLRSLALSDATLEIQVAGDPPADDVVFLFSANRGEPALPLTKIASGGELARVMLAVRLVLTGGPPVLVFDEVDAGVGGASAVAVGRALAALTPAHQVLVVTHLPQVAAFADAQIQVSKEQSGGRVAARASRLDHDERVVELSRMLAGQPESASARDHAAELLATATRERSA